MFVSKHESVFVSGCGRTGPDPGADITLDDGTVVPSGKGTNTSVQHSSLLYNEYPFSLLTTWFQLYNRFHTDNVLCLQDISEDENDT